MSGGTGSGRVPVRGGSHLRPGQGVRRASAGASLTRIGALVVLAAASVGLAQLSGPSVFAIRAVEIEGIETTDRRSVEAALLDVGPAEANLFRYDTAAAAARLERLPAVRFAAVRAVLPNRLVATVEERVAVIAWAVGGAAYLVDDEGLLFALAAPDRGTTVPTMIDRRPSHAGLAIGGRLDPVDLRVARQLAALTPGLLGSGAVALVAGVSDGDGYVLTTDPPSWTAVFGLYGEVSRSPELVPLQVQCLASLLADRGEGSVGRVVLSPEGQLCGTFSQS